MKKTYLFFIWSILLFAFHTRAQIITTIAGSGGTGAYGGDGGQATNALLGGPYGVAIDHSGNRYLADQYNNVVRIVTPAGIIKRFAGNAGGVGGFGGDSGIDTLAYLNNPTGVASDFSGNIYISDNQNFCIRKVNTLGIISTYAGTPTVNAYSGDGSAATAAKMGSTQGIAVDNAGNLYICDIDFSVVRKVTPSGIISTVAGTGTGGFNGDGISATTANLDQPMAVAVDASGNIFIADYGNNKIRKVNTAGIISTVAGTTAGFSGDGGLATAAKLNGPTGIAIDTLGRIYITDANNNRIRRVYKTGVIYTIAGSNTAGYSGDGAIATHAWLNIPHGGFVDTSCAYTFADYANNRIRKVTNFVNSVPHFSGGHNQIFSVCINSTNDSINTLMTVNETDSGQVMHWKIIDSTVHGSLYATYNAVSNSLALLTTGLIYTPAAGYSGMDSFRILVTDGIDFDTTKIHITVNPLMPYIGAITGADSLCPGDTLHFADSVAGGFWRSTNTSIATVGGSSGIVTAVSSGLDTIIYYVTTVCSFDTATTQKTVYVRLHTDCNVGQGMVIEPNFEGLQVYPNPNNGSFYLNITSPDTDNRTVAISNILGEKIEEINVTSNTPTEISLSEPAGVYYISISNSVGIRQYSKIIVQH